MLSNKGTGEENSCTVRTMQGKNDRKMKGKRIAVIIHKMLKKR